METVIQLKRNIIQRYERCKLFALPPHIEQCDKNAIAKLFALHTSY